MDKVKVFIEKLPSEENELLRQEIVLDGKKERLNIIKFQQKIYIFLDKCPHQGKSLGRVEFTEDGEVRCEHHGMRFKLATGENTFSAGYISIPNLLVFPLQKEGDKFFVEIDLEAVKKL